MYVVKMTLCIHVHTNMTKEHYYSQNVDLNSAVKLFFSEVKGQFAKTFHCQCHYNGWTQIKNVIACISNYLQLMRQTQKRRSKEKERRRKNRNFK